MISTRSVGLLIDTVVCLTLAKWETVSGRFGGYLTRGVSDLMERGDFGRVDVIDTAGRSRPRRREPLAAPKHGGISNVPHTYDRRSIGSHALSRRVRAAQIQIDHRRCGVGVDICRAADLDRGGAVLRRGHAGPAS